MAAIQSFVTLACAAGCQSCDASGAPNCDYAGGCTSGYTMKGGIQCSGKHNYGY